MPSFAARRARWSGSGAADELADARHRPPSAPRRDQDLPGAAVTGTRRAPSGSAPALPAPAPARPTRLLRLTRSASAGPAAVCSEAEVAADELLHDLVGAGPDLRHARIAPGA